MGTPWLRTRLSVHNFITGAAYGAWIPILSKYVEGLGFSPLEITLTCACGTAAFVLSTMVAGPVADRWIATEKLIGLINLGAAGAFAWASTLTSFATLAPVLLLAATFFVPTFPLQNALAFRHLPDPARQFPPIRAAQTVGWIAAGVVLTLWLRGPGEGRLGHSLLLTALLNVVNGLFAFTLPSSPPARPVQGRGAPAARALALFREPSFAVFGAALFIFMIFANFFYPYAGLYLPSIGFQPADVPFLLTFCQVAEIFMLFLLPWAYARLGPKGTMLTGIGLWALRYLLFALALPWPVVLLALGLHGPGFAFSRIAATIYADRVAPADARASVQSLLSLIIDGVGGLLGAVVAGLALGRFAGNWALLWGIPTAGGLAAFALLAAGFRAQRSPVENFSPNLSAPTVLREAEE